MLQSFGERLAYWRRLRGLSQRALGRLAGYSGTYVSELEKGTARNPTLQAAERLAAALAVTVGDLWPESVPLVQPDDPELLRRIEEQKDWLDELSPQTRRIAIQNMIEGLENRRRRELAEEKRRRREEAHPDDPPTSAAG